MKIFKFVKSNKTKVDEQIDTMQLSVANELDKVDRFLKAIVDTVDNRRLLVDSDIASILNNTQHARYLLKNLASDLKSDARL